MFESIMLKRFVCCMLKSSSHSQTTAFVSGLILLLNIWSGKRSGYAPNPKREMEDVQRCMEILKSSENRYGSNCYHVKLRHSQSLSLAAI